MRLFKSGVVAMVAVLIVTMALGLFAQTASPNSYAATIIETSASTGATLTIPAVGNFNIYVTALDIANCAGASAVTAAAVTTITTTNLAGNPSYTLGSGSTAGGCQPEFAQHFPTGLKSTVNGTAVTFVLPTFATNQTVRMNVYAYYAQ